MLVLSRKKDEEIVFIDESGHILARLTIVKIEGSKVRIGVEAEQSLKILRGELNQTTTQTPAS